MEKERILNALKFNGFTDYEARIYLALLQKNPLNGNSIAVEAGVPNAKVYENLKRMKSKGIIFEVSQGSKQERKNYVPLPYQDLLNTLKDEFTSNTNLLEDYFKQMSTNQLNDWNALFHIEGYEPALEVIREIIAEAKNEIIISCWSKELEGIYPNLLKAHQKGIPVTSLLFDSNNMDIPWKNFFHHESENAKNRHANELSCVVDQHKVVILDSIYKDAYAIVSSHQIMVSTTRNYIRHDIYVNRLLRDLRKESEKLYGENLDGLINDF